MRNTNIIIENALDLAHKIDACAIIVFGDLPIDDYNIQCDIPIYVISKRPKNFIKYMISASMERTQDTDNISSQIFQETTGNVEHLEKIAAIEYFLDRVSQGVVLGLIESFDSTSIIVHKIEENPIVKVMEECEDRISSDVLKAILTIALEIADAGREGKKVGTAFVVGDVEEVLKRSHQIIINPYYGHSDNERSVLNTENWESIKEFAQIDGVFIISDDGYIHAAGRYLDIDARDVSIDKGLGGRHVSAATITRDTVALAVTISESGGVVRVYMDGIMKFSIETSERVIKLN